jgi:hypothetical protein
MVEYTSLNRNHSFQSKHPDEYEELKLDEEDDSENELIEE